MKAVVYIRTCSDYNKRFASAEKQYEAIRLYCSMNGIEIVAAFEEDSIYPPFKRYEFNNMVQFLKKNEGINYVICYKYINLSANTPDFISALLILDELDCEIQVTHLKAYDMRKDTPQKAKWIELN